MLLCKPQRILCRFLRHLCLLAEHLKQDGIITVSKEALKHSTLGDFTNLKNPKKPPSDKNGGKMKGGGHSQTNIDELLRRNISYKIEKTYENGVRIGGVEGHKTEVKRIGHSEQAWFPKNWNDDEVLKAGTYVANNSKDTGMPKFAEYNGVRVGIFIDGDGYPSTIFPDGSRQPKRSDD